MPGGGVCSKLPIEFLYNHLLMPTLPYSINTSTTTTPKQLTSSCVLDAFSNVPHPSVRRSKATAIGARKVIISHLDFTSCELEASIKARWLFSVIVL